MIYAILSARSRPARRAVFALLAALAVFSVAPSPGRAGDCCPGPGLTLFFTSDTRGMLRRCGCSEGQMGGLSARAGYIKAEGTPGRTLVLDAGDTFFDGLEADPARREYYIIKARTMAAAMAAAGTAATAVGEYDLAYGPDFLVEAVNAAGFPFLCANATWPSGEGLQKPFAAGTVVELEGVRVGVVGVLGAGFPYRDFAANFGPVDVADPAEAAQAYIDRLRPDVDLVVVLAHLSVDSAEEFTGRLRGADIVIQGHSPEYLEAPERIGGSLLMKGYMMGKHLGRLDLWLDRPAGEGARIVGYEFSVAALDEGVMPDPEVEGIISSYRRTLAGRQFVFERPAPVGAGEYAGPQACRGCHQEAYSNWSATGHARAFSSLERTDDQYDPECLPCHTTGYGYPTGYATLARTPGLVNVTCESCHGAGRGHASGGRGEGGVAHQVPEDVCLKCHDEPNSPYFEYEEYLGRGGAHGALQ